MRELTIGRLAAKTGVNLETIRYYERIGMIPRPALTKGGHRSYTEVEARRLAFIRRARELGFSLDEIRALLALAEAGQAACAEVRPIAQAHLENVRAKLADLAKLEKIFSETVSRCSDTASPHCPVLDMLQG